MSDVDDPDLIAQRQRELANATNFAELREMLVEPGYTELNRNRMRASMVEAEAERRRDLGQFIIVHRRSGSDVAEISERRRLSPLVKVAHRGVLIQIIEDILRRMECLGETPMERLATGRALCAAELPGLLQGMPVRTEPNPAPPAQGAAAVPPPLDGSAELAAWDLDD
jgi:hypothetical protein